MPKVNNLRHIGDSLSEGSSSSNEREANLLRADEIKKEKKASLNRKSILDHLTPRHMMPEMG